MTGITRFIERFLQLCFLLFIDLCAFYLSLFIAWVTRDAVFPLFFSQLPFFHFSYMHFVWFWWMPGIFLFFLFFEGLYDNNLPFWDETRYLVKSISLASITLMAIVTLGKMSDVVSRIVLISVWMISVFVFPVFRLWGKKLLYKTGIWKERVLILGAGNCGRLVLQGLQRETHMGYEVVGFLDDDEKKIGTTLWGKKVFGRIDDYLKFTLQMNVRTAIISMPSISSERLSSITAKVQNTLTHTMVIPDLKGIALLNTDLAHLFNEELFLMNIKNNLKSPSNRLMKTLFDYVMGVLFLPLLLPVLEIICAFIRIESRGPAMYAHERIGKNGRIFKCYKFRTMQRDAEEKLKELLEASEEIRTEWKSTWKLKDDPRITRAGRFLRKTSLDELPQILNVLKGEMSIVGPRPYLPRERDSIQENIQVICSAKPGITGLWQVSGRSDTGYRHRVKLDAWYVMNWSLWFDIAIIFKTIRVVLKGQGAY
jgi:undecaprenyl-phosphate galactose phosphotransferase